jgi:hypothetical protein
VLGARVTDPQRNRKYDSARVRIANAAFLPGKIFDDTSVWNSQTASRRQLLIGGRFENGKYQLDAAPVVAYPARPAESRHVIHLTKLSDDAEYAWDTEVPFAMGSVKASEVGAFFAAMLAAAEGRGEKEVRADIAATIPRASAVLGQLFTIDSIRTTHFPDSSTLATFAVRMHPEGVEGRFPFFARYMRSYAVTTKLSFTLTDRDSVAYVDCRARGDGTLRLTVRTRRGEIVALTGAPKPLPDSTTLNGELAVKVRRFTVGFHDYHAEFALVRTAHERAFSIVSRREPQWTLPFITEHLIRTPLRRPFQGSGASFRIGFRDSTGAQTILNRRLHLEVKESLILRFIGRLGATALGDWVGKAEREQMAWLEEVFDALVKDSR